MQHWHEKRQSFGLPLSFKKLRRFLWLFFLRGILSMALFGRCPAIGVDSYNEAWAKILPNWRALRMVSVPTPCFHSKGSPTSCIFIDSL